MLFNTNIKQANTNEAQQINQILQFIEYIQSKSNLAQGDVAIFELYNKLPSILSHLSTNLSTKGSIDGLNELANPNSTFINLLLNCDTLHYEVNCKKLSMLEYYLTWVLSIPTSKSFSKEAERNDRKVNDDMFINVYLNLLKSYLVFFSPFYNEEASILKLQYEKHHLVDISNRFINNLMDKFFTIKNGGPNGNDFLMRCCWEYTKYLTRISASSAPVQQQPLSSDYYFSNSGVVDLIRQNILGTRVRLVTFIKDCLKRKEYNHCLSEIVLLVVEQKLFDDLGPSYDYYSTTVATTYTSSGSEKSFKQENLGNSLFKDYLMYVVNCLSLCVYENEIDYEIVSDLFQILIKANLSLQKVDFDFEFDKLYTKLFCLKLVFSHNYQKHDVIETGIKSLSKFLVLDNPEVYEMRAKEMVKDYKNLTKPKYVTDKLTPDIKDQIINGKLILGVFDSVYSKVLKSEFDLNDLSFTRKGEVYFLAVVLVWFSRVINWGVFKLIGAEVKSENVLRELAVVDNLLIVGVILMAVWVISLFNK